MKSFFIFLLLFLLSTQTVLAQTDTDFNIRVLVGTDTEAPSTPTLLSASPITTTQIDIAWSASTDNFSVAGYSLLRDSIPFATTTLLNYSDTGLTASTTYAYSVRAFDVALNYSTTSNSLSTSTPDIPVVIVDDSVSSSQSTAVKAVIEGVVIDEGISTTSLYFQTKFPSRLEFRWGKTASYELGYIVSTNYKDDYSIHLSELEPGTTYEYQIIGAGIQGPERIVKTGSFTTLSNKIVEPPANIMSFAAVSIGNDVSLSWKFQEIEKTSQVRIVRSHLSFPNHPTDGAIVYQGLKDSFVDSGVLSQFSPAYYTAFVYDDSGNVSSGAVAIVYATYDGDKDGFESVIKPGSVGSDVKAVEDATSTVITERVTVDMKMPELFNVAVIQKGNRYSMFDSLITLDIDRRVLISIPKEEVAGNLKSIIATVVNPVNTRETYSYLLRINNDRTSYEAVIPPFRVEGESQLLIEIYDYEAFVVATYQTSLLFSYFPEPVSGAVVFPDILYSTNSMLFMVLILLLMLIIVALLIKQKTSSQRSS